ncbi:MAG: diacylglycerol kinase family protein [Thermodesulfovibrionia bacterium]
MISLKASLIANPVAGKRAFRSIKKIEDMLREKVSLTTFITRKQGDAHDFAKKKSGTDLIIVAGGDGTFNEVINGVLCAREIEPDRGNSPLALVPLGTTNVLAQELGIPKDIKKAVNLALTGTPKKISLGRINGSYFTLMAGIGFDGQAVLGVKNNIKKIAGKGAYIISGFKALYGYNPPLIEIKTRDGTFTGYSAVVGNSRCYAGRFQVTPRADIIKPELDLCLLKRKTKTSLLKFVSGIIMKRHLKLKDVLYGKYSELEISSKKPVHVQIDGDYFGTLPVKITAIKDAVNVIW